MGILHSFNPLNLQSIETRDEPAFIWVACVSIKDDRNPLQSSDRSHISDVVYGNTACYSGLVPLDVSFMWSLLNCNGA